jgi:hypothetical protein
LHPAIEPFEQLPGPVCTMGSQFFLQVAALVAHAADPTLRGAAVALLSRLTRKNRQSVPK